MEALLAVVVVALGVILWVLRGNSDKLDALLSFEDKDHTAIGFLIDPEEDEDEPQEV